jgi:hypothetical protein
MCDNADVPRFLELNTLLMSPLCQRTTHNS